MNNAQKYIETLVGKDPEPFEGWFP